MPSLPGEEHLLTLFTDIHYYFSAPESKPLFHRFDKESYFYVYHDASQRRVRIEVANSPGTLDQDAFHGALDKVILRHSTAFPTRCTLTVDGLSPDQQEFPPPPPSEDPHEWQLHSKNPGDGNKELLRLHTLDIYFWTLNDADRFLDLIGAILGHGRIDSDRQWFPAQSDKNGVSSVVQQLENVAVADPVHGVGQTQDSGIIPSPQNIIGTTTLPPPPPPPPPGGGPSTFSQPRPISTGGQSHLEERQSSVDSTPLPYNPAAPAAPEPVKHRDKTPPPADAADGTGLAAAVAADYGILHNSPSQSPDGGGYGPTSSQALPNTRSSYAAPPASIGLSQPKTSFSPAPTVAHPRTTPHLSQPSAVTADPSFTQFPTSAIGQSSTMPFVPLPQFPNTHLYGQQPNIYSPQSPLPPPPPPVQSQPEPLLHTQVQRQQPAPPLGVYSNNPYQQSPPGHRQTLSGIISESGPGSASEYDVHSQLYRPTQIEAESHSQKHAQKAMKHSDQRPRKLEDGASRVESGVNRFLRKLEKKL